MKLRHAALLIAPLLLAACASTGERVGPPAPRPPAPASAPTIKPPPRPAPAPQMAAPGTIADTLTYRCAGGKRFTAAWGLPGDRVKVTAGGATRLLDARPSASGARYGEGPFQIWGKGDTAMLEGFPGGPYEGCRTN